MFGYTPFFKYHPFIYRININLAARPYKLARHIGHVDARCNQRWIHIVWNWWLHASLSVPKFKAQWQMEHIDTGSDSESDSDSESRSMTNLVFKCHKTGQHEEIYSCKKRSRGGVFGCFTIHSSTFSRTHWVVKLGGAHNSSTILNKSKTLNTPTSKNT